MHYTQHHAAHDALLPPRSGTIATKQGRRSDTLMVIGGNVAPEDAQAELTPTILDLAPVEHRPSSQPLTRHMDFTGNDDRSAKEAAVGTLKDETRTVTPTRRSYGAITGNGETRIHAGDHIGAYNDLRTTVSTACQEQSSWTRIGADVVSRVLASIVHSSFHIRWSPKPARSSDTCAQPVISDTVAATDRHVTPKGYQATEAPNIMTKTTESNLATEESASWVAQYTNFFAALGDAPCPIEDAGFSRRLHSGQAQPLTIRQRDKPHDAGHHLKPLRRAPAQDYAGPDSSVRETRSTATNSAALAQRLNNANNDSALTAEVPTALRAHDDSLVPHAEKIAGEQSLTGAYVPPPSGQYFNEKLGEDFRLYPGEHSRTLFRPGSVIAVFWHDNCGRSLTAPPADRSYQQSCISTIKGEKVYSHIRRFVIVQRRSKFMIGLPISTYSGKRLTDSERMAHATFYNLGGERRRLSDEQRFIKPTICVDLSVSGQTLSYNSRINYAKPYSIDHNIKIKYLGSVIDEDLRALLLSFRAEMFPSGDDEDSDTTVDS